MKFIADISSNHCGDLQKAKDLIYAAKECGADYAKFQYWETENFISKERFDKLKIGHQKNWNQSVYDTYKKYEVPAEWIPILYDECQKVGIEFLLSCYELSKMDEFDKYVKAWKIGSGDISYIPILFKIASKEKPVFLGLGASSTYDFYNALSILQNKVKVYKFICNTNYSANDEENIKYLNLKRIAEYNLEGLSDHTKSDVPIISAITMGVQYIERHFKIKDNDSPDNCFSLEPVEWKHMVLIANQTVDALGDGRYMIQDNETETRIIQRRSEKDWRRPDNG